MAIPFNCKDVVCIVAAQERQVNPFPARFPRIPMKSSSVDVLLIRLGALLISPRRWHIIACSAYDNGLGDFRMNDLVFVVLIVGFFVVSGLYVRFCDKL
jgi:hypothetical protein